MLHERTSPGDALDLARELDARPVDALADVDAEEWDALVPPGAAPLLHAYVAAWLNAELAGLEERPLAARDDEGTLLAAAPGFLYDLDIANIQTPLLARIVGAVRKLVPRLLMLRIYEVGSAAAGIDPLALRHPDLDPLEAADSLLEAARREGDRKGANLSIVQDLADQGSPTARALRRRGFRPVPLPPTLVAELPFDSFDEYLDAMRSQYRRRARKVLDESSHLRVEQLREFADLAPELARLWKLVYDRATEMRREVLPERFFREASEVEQTRLLLLRREDDSIACFALLLDDSPWLHFLYTGFEEDAGREEGAYFRLLYEIARIAIEEEDFERVNFGITTEAPKMDAGARPVPLTAWLRHRNRLLLHLFWKLATGPFAPEPVEARRVFKED